MKKALTHLSLEATNAGKLARIIAKRFGDDALNACGYRDVQSLLATRFMRRLPDGRSPSGLPDTEIKRVANSHSGPSAGSPILHPE
jgi:hypothetical protein